MAKQDGTVVTLAQMFRILGDPTRLRILMELRAGEKNVTALCKRLKAPQPTVSHHLGILRMGQLAVSRRSGKEIFYSISNLESQRYGKALQSLLKSGTFVRFGSVVLGMV